MKRDDYIRDHWPKDVPDDCTKLNSEDEDCGEQGLIAICLSCKTFIKLDDEAYSIEHPALAVKLIKTPVPKKTFDMSPDGSTFYLQYDKDGRPIDQCRECRELTYRDELSGDSDNWTCPACTEKKKP